MIESDSEEKLEQLLHQLDFITKEMKKIYRKKTTNYKIIKHECSVIFNKPYVNNG